MSDHITNLTITCNTFDDLLPLYQEQLLSEDSKKLLKQHASICPKCQVKLDQNSDFIPQNNPSSNNQTFKPTFSFSRIFQVHNILFILLLCLMQIAGMYFYYHSIVSPSYPHPLLHQITFTYFFYIPLLLTLFGIFIAKCSNVVKKIILFLFIFVFSIAISVLYFYYTGFDSMSFTQIESYFKKYSYAPYARTIIGYVMIPLVCGFLFETVYLQIRNKLTRDTYSLK